MNKTSSTKSILILVILGLIVLIGADAFLFYSIRNKNLEVNQIVSQNNVLSAEESQASSFQTIAAATAADRAALDSYVLQKSDQVSFVSELSDLAKLADVSITVSNLGNTPNYLTASIKVRGNWVEVFHFLMLVESMPYSIGINMFQFERDVASTKNVLWDGAFTISVLTNGQ